MSEICIKTVADVALQTKHFLNLKAFGKGGQNWEGDCTNLICMILMRMNDICSPLV